MSTAYGHLNGEIMQDLRGKRAVKYLRISDDSQVGNTSIETQDQVTQAYCDQVGMRVVHTIRLEGVSASQDNEKRVEDLINYCQQHKGEFDALVVYKLSRFARSVRQHQHIRYKLMKLGILLRSATETVDESPIGQLTENQLASFAQFDNEVRRENCIRGMSRRIQQGLWPWTPCLGYFLPKVEGIRLSVAQWDQSCYEEVKNMFDLYASGNFSMVQLANWMTRKKIRNYRGSIVKFNDQYVRYLLTDKFYIGLLANPFEDGKLYPGQHKRLIDKETWEAVQSVIIHRGQRPNRRIKLDNPLFPLRDFIFHTCGDKYTAANCRSRNGSLHPYYFCKSRDSKSYRIGDVHEAFATYLDQLTPESESVKLFFNEVLDILEQRLESYGSERDEADRQLDLIKSKAERLITAYLDGVIEQTEFARQKLMIDNQKTELSTQIEQSDNGSLDFDLKDVMYQAEEFILSFATRWKNGTPAEKRLVTGSIFPQGLVFDGISHRTKGSPLVLQSILAGYGSNFQRCEPGADRTHDAQLKRLSLYH